MEMIIDIAPGKELIPIIIGENSFAALNRFYTIRVDWNGYPLIHDRMFTYSVFEDLLNAIPQDKDVISQFIDYAIEIAMTENDKRFANAIFLLSNFCGSATDSATPTQLLKIIELKPRVQRLSFLSNLVTFWQKVIVYCATAPSFQQDLLEANEKDYERYFDMNFPSIDNNTPASCPMGMAEIDAEMEVHLGEYKVAFVRSAIIQADRYWVWLYTCISGKGWHWYFIVKQAADGKITTKKQPMQGLVMQPAEQVLLHFHYD